MFDAKVCLLFYLQENSVTNPRVIQTLLSARADPNLKNKIKETAVCVAVKKFDIPVLEMLIVRNGELNSPLSDGDHHYTPLGYAIKKQNLDMISFLLDQGQRRCIYKNGPISELSSDCMDIAIGTRNSHVINLLSDENFIRDEL